MTDKERIPPPENPKEPGTDHQDAGTPEDQTTTEDDRHVTAGDEGTADERR